MSANASQPGPKLGLVKPSVIYGLRLFIGTHLEDPGVLVPLVLEVRSRSGTVIRNFWTDFRMPLYYSLSAAQNHKSLGPPE